jgi:hypothetical protein
LCNEEVGEDLWIVRCLVQTGRTLIPDLKQSKCESMIPKIRRSTNILIWNFGESFALSLESTSKPTQESFGKILKCCKPLGLIFLFRVLIIFPLINFVVLRFGSTLFFYSTMQK